MFNYFKKAAISNRVNDEILFEHVLTEMETGFIAKGLWGKALANSEGNDATVKSIYMKYRVQAIKDIFTSMEIVYDELSKPKLIQYIRSKVFSISNDIIQNELESMEIETENYKTTREEESIFDEVADELSNGTRKEGLWLKAIQNTNGDENKALALYIKYRSESIKDEKIRDIAFEKQRAKKASEIKAEQEFKRLYGNKDKISNELEVYLQKKRMRLVKKESFLKVKANYFYTPIEVDLEYIAGEWKIIT